LGVFLITGGVYIYIYIYIYFMQFVIRCVRYNIIAFCCILRYPSLGVPSRPSKSGSTVPNKEIITRAGARTGELKVLTDSVFHHPTQ